MHASLHTRYNRRRHTRVHWIRRLILGIALFILPFATYLVASSSFASPAVSTTLDKVVESRGAVKERDQASLAKPPQGTIVAGLPDFFLYLPIAHENISAIGFHALESRDLVSLNPNGEQINGDFITAAFKRFRSENKTQIQYYLFGGETRRSTPRGGLDIGARPGTAVYSPVNGEVIAVRHYKIAGRYDDVQVEISPTNAPNYVVVINHIQNVNLALGNTVGAGETPIGNVRGLSHFYPQELSEVTSDPGDHVHIEVRRLAQLLK